MTLNFDPHSEAATINADFIKASQGDSGAQSDMEAHLNLIKHAYPADRAEFAKELHQITPKGKDGDAEEASILQKIGFGGARVNADGSIDLNDGLIEQQDTPLQSSLYALLDLKRPLEQKDFSRLSHLLNSSTALNSDEIDALQQALQQRQAQVCKGKSIVSKEGQEAQQLEQILAEGLMNRNYWRNRDSRKDRLPHD